MFLNLLIYIMYMCMYFKIIKRLIIILISTAHTHTQTFHDEVKKKILSLISYVWRNEYKNNCKPHLKKLICAFYMTGHNKILNK